MYNIIPLILILLSIGVIVLITVRKFPVLANVDVENIKEEKEKRFKEKIISNRLKRSIIKWSSKFARAIRPIWQAVGNLFRGAFKKLHELKESYKSEPVLRVVNFQEKIDKLLNEAKGLREKKDFETAEKKLIEVISLDNKNTKAFKELGSLYFEGKNFNEAKETFIHVLKLVGEEDSEVYFDLALLFKEMGNIIEALSNINKALAIEPNNPRYLDTLLDLSIINKDKAQALEAYKKLKKANPNNQKLAELRKQIDEL